MRFAPASPTSASSRASAPGPVGHAREDDAGAAPPRSRGGGRPCASSPASTLPPREHATVVPSARRATRPAEQRGDADGAGALDDELGLLEQQRPSPRRSPPRPRARRRRPIASMSASVSSPGRLTAMPSAIVSAASTSTGSPRLQRRRERRARLDLHADDLDRRAARTSPRSRRRSPARRRRPGRRPSRGRATSSSSSSPSVPWPATTSGSSNGCTNAMPASLGARARPPRRSRRPTPAAVHDAAPSAARALDLGDRRLARHEDLARDAARRAAANASACAWLPALPATTPSAARGRRARRACSARRGS